MAGSQITTSVSILNSLLGFQAISLSEMNTSAATVIKQGSKVEIKSAFFTFGSDLTPNATSWTVITTGLTAYIHLTPSGTAGSQIVSGSWSSTAPVWSDAAQGWYASAASSMRVIGGCIKNGATSYESKFVLDAKEMYNGKNARYVASTESSIVSLKVRIIEIGDWDMSTTTTSVFIDTTDIEQENAMFVQVNIRPDEGEGSDVRPLPNISSIDSAEGNTYWRWYPSTSIYTLQLRITTGGFFNQAAYNQTSYNRGWIAIWYI